MNIVGSRTAGAGTRGLPVCEFVMKDSMLMEVTRSGAPHFLCRGSPQARVTQLGHRLGSSASLQVQVQQLYTGKAWAVK
jgi:hypothetical protein